MKTLSEPHGSADGGTLTGAEEEAHDQSRSRGSGGSVRAGTPWMCAWPFHPRHTEALPVSQRDLVPL